jgi:hypothetical protein
MTCDGTRTNGQGQLFCMVSLLGMVAQVHYCSSSNVHILNATPPLATRGVIVIANHYTKGVIVCQPLTRSKEREDL